VAKGQILSQNNNEQPFGELPEALVEEMLSQCNKLGSNLSASFKTLHDDKNEIRSKLYERKLLHKDTDFSFVPSYPTSCAVDGSFALERLICTDLVAFAGVAMEGLTPPSEKRYWPNPHHISHVLTVPHSDNTASIARAVMMCMELELAATAPHDVVFLDGSLTTPLISLNQGLNRIADVNEELAAFLLTRAERALESYQKIVSCERTDKIFAGIPKYTTRTEISKDVLNLREYEDRGLLTFVLDAGEFVGPVPIQKIARPWHLKLKSIQCDTNLEETAKQIFSGLNDLQILYYRPYGYFPVLRIEIANSIATNPNRLAILLESLRLQCSSPSILEPFPLYLADRMVKHLGTALPAIRRTTTQQMSTEWEDKMGNTYLAMHGYRTNLGR
jgi:hypothetical protein